VIAFNRTGRYVRVQLAGSQYLVMGEVQVWGGNTGQVNWIVPNHLGTPRLIADQTGSLANVKRHDYLPFGEEIGLIGGRTGLKGFMNDGTRQKFTGYERDAETGLDYAKARYDASAQGRFLSVDPLLASASKINPQSHNRYAYCLNNPTNLTDPSGLMPYSGADQSWTSKPSKARCVVCGPPEPYQVWVFIPESSRYLTTPSQPALAIIESSRHSVPAVRSE
jgi:RHS repeat-associated protein